MNKTLVKHGGIVKAMASSGLAATLLDGCRTAQSALKLPFKVQVGMGKVLKPCALIVCDECTMAHNRSLIALDSTLKNLRGNGLIIGGALILLADDFQKTLLVIPRSTGAD